MDDAFFSTLIFCVDGAESASECSFELVFFRTDRCLLLFLPTSVSVVMACAGRTTAISYRFIPIQVVRKSK